MDTKRFNEEHAAKSRAVCERIEREDAERRGKLADLVDAQLKGELGRAKAEADGWRKIAERRLKHTDECEAALAKRNERISKLEKQVGYLRAELANAKVLSERKRKILDMWPRFEDGELVWFGDAYIDGRGDANEVRDVRFDDKYVCLVGVEGFHTAFIIGERVKRPAPKVLDADGVEIKVGDTVWDGDGVEMTVMSLVGELPGHVTTHSNIPPAMHSIDPKRLTHVRPDSWERLEEDAEKIRRDIAHNLGDFSPSDFDDERDTVQFRVTDLVRRAKALAGIEAGR